MIFIDYYFEVGANGNLAFDRELTLEKLNWAPGDKFEVKLINNRIVLHKIEQGATNETDQSTTVSSEGAPFWPVF